MWGLSLLISISLAWILYPKLQGDVLVKALGRLGIKTFVLVVFFWLCGLVARTLQLQLLLPERIPFKTLLLVVMVRNFAVDLLPARSLSLFAHTVMLHRHHVDTATAGASFAYTSVINAMSMVILLLPSLLFVQGDFSVPHFLTAMLLLLALGGLFLRYGGRLGGLLNRLPWPAWRSWGCRWTRYFKEMGRFKRLVMAFLLGFCGRLSKYLLLFALFSTFSGIDFSFRTMPAFFLALSGAELSGMLPISGIAGFGTWELAFVLMAEFLNLQTPSPLEIGLLIHVFTQAWEAFWALGALLLFRLKFRPSSSA